MKTKHLKRILWMAAIISIALLLIWLRKKQSVTSNREVAPPIAEKKAPAETNPPVSEPQNHVRPSGLPAATNGATEYSQEARLSMAENMNESVNFYAKVVDQDEQGIPVVKIRMTIRRWIPSANQTVGTFPVTGEFEECDLVSDAVGNFQITGKTGDSLRIKAIEKSGYELSPQQQKSVGPSSGNPENPVIIRMWKKGQAEPLIIHSKSFDAAPDGRTNMVSLMTGVKTESATLDDQSIAISIDRPANASDTGTYDWSVRIQVAGGGLLESQDEFMYRAPENGYEPNLVFQFKKDDPEWVPMMKKRFYLKTSQAIHGNIELEVYPTNLGGKTTFRLHSVINPSGSRNLEYDPAVQPKPKVYE